MTLTLARVEVNEFWDKILKGQSLGIQNLVPELIYLGPSQSYSQFGGLEFTKIRKSGILSRALTFFEVFG